MSLSPYIYIYIYVYCHPQTCCFVVSQPFSVARHVERLKFGPKPAQLYVRLSIEREREKNGGNVVDRLIDR